MRSDAIIAAASTVSEVMDLFSDTATGGPRQLLSCFLIAACPNDVLGEDDDVSSSADTIATRRLKALVIQTAANSLKASKRFLEHANRGSLQFLDDLLRRYLGFVTVFTEWRKMDK